MSLIEDALLWARLKGDTRTVSTNAGTAVMCIRSTSAALITATVEVDATTGDYEFTTDGTTADLTVGLPTLDGTIDVSETGAVTMGAVIDNINASANWEAYPLGLLRNDISTNTTATLAETTAPFAGSGVKTYFDPAVELFASANHAGCSLAITAEKFIPGAGRINQWDNGGFWNELTYMYVTLTNAGTNIDVEIYECDDRAGTQTILAKVALATTVNTTIGNGLAPFMSSSRGSRLLVRPTGDDADTTAGIITVMGRSVNPDLIIH
ncbi:MAG: hypothetical protein KAR42_17620 [candidate division Zixibacteria bacterium]|nr:hypothetical protein [candidate division Zixibacteria bacterium]